MTDHRQRAPETCANCGAAIPPRARACPECGADERTGWAEQSIYDGLDLPGDEAKNAPDPTARNVNGLAWYWWAAGLALILILVMVILGLR